LQPIGDHGLRGFKPGCLTPLDGIRGSEMSGDFRIPSLPRRVTEGGNISAPPSVKGEAARTTPVGLTAMLLSVPTAGTLSTGERRSVSVHWPDS
jgi:hypothetical protein